MPSPDQYTFDVGYDYTATFGGYAPALTQGTQLQTPNSQHGIVAYMETQPLTTGSPSGSYPANWYSFNTRGLWVKPSTGETYSYKAGFGFTNVASLIPANTITGTMVKANTINLSNLYVPPGTTAGFVPMVNGGGTLSFADPVNGRVDGSITVAKIAPGANNQFLRTIGGITAWDTFDGADINALLANGGLDQSAIAPGGPYQVPYTVADGLSVDWGYINNIIQTGSLPVDKLAGTGATAGQMPVRNSSNTGWAWATPAVASPITTKWNSGLLTLTSQTVPHTPTISGLPSLWNVVLVCTTAELGYTVNDEVDFGSFVYDDSGNATDSVASIMVDSNNFTIKMNPLSAGGANIYTLNKSSGAKSAINTANWRFKIYAIN